MGFEPTIEVLQTSALPLGYVALTFGILAQSVCLVKPMGRPGRTSCLAIFSCNVSSVILSSSGRLTSRPRARSRLCVRAVESSRPAPGRQRGLVKWYSRGKGYGFITPAEGADVFVHKSGLGATADSLRAGQLVEFGVSQGARGMQAEQVVVLETDEGPRTKDE